MHTVLFPFLTFTSQVDGKANAPGMEEGLRVNVIRKSLAVNALCLFFICLLLRDDGGIICEFNLLIIEL